ncbi:hypothetical protein Taro_025935, partial [Colocasia esculenta]|nr:hypothetical protein [Colocasia esculenta]
LASTSGRRGGVNVQTWTPSLTQASSDVDVNLSDLHAQQSCCLLKQGMATHWGMSPNGSKALDLEIYCNKEEAEAKEKASPSSPRRGDHPGTWRKAILKTMAGRGRRGAQSRRYEQNRKLKNFVKGLKPSVRTRLLELDSRTLGELLGVTTHQEKGSGSLPEGEATPKEKPLESQQSTVASSIEKPECTQCGKRHDEVHSARRFTDRDIGARVAGNDRDNVATGVVSDMALLEETVETDSERGD